MTISLKNLTPTTSTRHFPLITLYGRAGIGKTTLAAEFPNPLILNIERGIPDGVDAMATPVTRHYPSIMDFLDELRKEDHEYKTLIVDSIDAFEQLALFPHVCENLGVNSMDFNKNFGKSYVQASEKFGEFMRACELLRVQKRMFVIFTARAVKGSFDDPVEGSWSRHDLQLHSRIAPTVFHESDFVFYMKPKVELIENSEGNMEVRGDMTPVVCTKQGPHFVAKTRTAGWPAEFDYVKGEGFSRMREHLLKFVMRNKKAPQEMKKIVKEQYEKIPVDNLDEEAIEREAYKIFMIIDGKVPDQGWNTLDEREQEILRRSQYFENVYTDEDMKQEPKTEEKPKPRARTTKAKTAVKKAAAVAKSPTTKAKIEETVEDSQEALEYTEEF